METKKCRGCGREKLLTYFWKNSASKDGYRATCIMCETTQYAGPSTSLPTNPTTNTTKDIPIKNGILSGEHPPDGPESIPNLYQFHHQPDGEISDYNPCPACNKSSHLFTCTLYGSTDTVKLSLCSSCILHSEYGDIVYAKLYGSVYAIRLIET